MITIEFLLDWYLVRHAKIVMIVSNAFWRLLSSTRKYHYTSIANKFSWRQGSGSLSECLQISLLDKDLKRVDPGACFPGWLGWLGWLL